MEKNNLLKHFFFRHQKKMMLMQAMFVLAIVFLLPMSTGAMQTKRITLKGKSISIRQVFEELKRQTDMYFMYNEKDVEKCANLDLNLKELSLDVTLQELTEKTPFEFEIIEDYVIVKKKKVSPQEQQYPENITGKVVDEQGNPIPGVNIIVIRNNIGTVSDIDGNFEISSGGMPNNILRFSFIGMETLDQVDRGVPMKVVMKEKREGLEEVVVTGIFEQKRESYTGAVTTVGEKELKLFESRDLLSTLESIDPAFNIEESNLHGSDPNRLPNITIRGTSSLPSVNDLQNEASANLNTPLIILDGFEISLQRLMDLNNEEVQSISLLKDASATAIYGSRAANGVVVITLKDPEEGKLKVYLKSSLNIEQPDLEGYQLLNAEDKLELERLAGFYDSPYKPGQDLLLKEKYNQVLATVRSGTSTDWIAKPTRTGIGHKHNLRLEGGNKNLRYSASAGYNYIAGVMEGSNRETFNGDITLGYYHKKIIIKNQTGIGLNKSENSPYGSFSDYTKLNPYWVPYDEKGNLVRFLDNSNQLWDTYPDNPLYNASLNTIDESAYTRIANNLSLDWRILEELRFRTRFGISKQISNSDKYKPFSHTDFEFFTGDNLFRRGTYDYQTGESSSIDGSATLSYTKLFFEKHRVYLGVNYDMSQSNMFRYNVNVEGFMQDNLDFLGDAAQYALNRKPSGIESTTRRFGLTSNLNYTFDERFIADMSVRVDGSSQFGANKRMAPFGSVGLGWNIHNEDFFNRDRGASLMRLKGSYGVVGSQRFDPYQAISTYEYFGNSRYLGWMGSTLMGIANEDLEWQTTDQYNLGFESRWFKNRFQFNADVYYKFTESLLSVRDLPYSNGFKAYTENFGEVQNKGFELMSTIFLIRNTSKKIIWSVTGRVVHNRNRIVKISDALKEQTAIQMQAKGETPNRLVFEGDPQSAIYVVPSLGIDPSTGKEVFVTREGEVSYEWNSRDRVYAGQEEPKYRGNASTMFRYKGLTLNLAFSYHWGGQRYNQTLIQRVENADLQYNVDQRVFDQRWTKPGDRVSFRDLVIYDRTYASSRFVQDDAVLRCQNISLAYEASKDWIKRNLGMSSLRFQCNMQDIFYWSTIKRERGLGYPFSRRMSLAMSAYF
ncbi:SusC/RagA family TonB-linked outer membrane protein [Carboxylicivirga marina]|uniref:SusC/RagA family TonB-linked outer membrane protein n=1 Tax=Carboxylicivirga marina TaxID=2800988 RepID=A0ABS1HDY7_9BACT|nr:SusC/RagA family TonB-linked outer membrane protein [Carboxylicivirga marina]MBK3515846.1 SusC/RagA family TonB-linked outer membrane protein [Carboxylicivirga marina]